MLSAITSRQAVTGPVLRVTGAAGWRRWTGRPGITYVGPSFRPAGAGKCRLRGIRELAMADAHIGYEERSWRATKARNLIWRPPG